jgi:hypothetical protein
MFESTVETIRFIEMLRWVYLRIKQYRFVDISIPAFDVLLQLLAPVEIEHRIY